MRVKTFTAPSNSAAMEQVRAELGSNAIIIATQTDPSDGSAHVIAAVEPMPESIDIANIDDDTPFPDLDGQPIDETVRQALAFHGTSPRLTARLVDHSTTSGGTDPLSAFTVALDEVYAFQSLIAGEVRKPLLLVGPPGSGKTTTTAKLCTRERLVNRPVQAVSADTHRAGGIAQLEAFTRILQIDLSTVGKPEDLAAVVQNAFTEAIYIDTPGTNPFDKADMDFLLTLADAAGAEPILVLAAGGDPMESADVARAYADIGAQRMVITRLDMARRLGGLLSAADGAGLAFSDVGTSPHVAAGLDPIDAAGLAKLILPNAIPNNKIINSSEAAQ